MMTKLTTLILLGTLALTACDGADVPSKPDAAPRAWPTSEDAARALCSPLCRWEVRCIDGTELTQCEDDCRAEFCGLGDCSLMASGSDVTIDGCVRALHAEAASDGTCYAAPQALTSVCFDAILP